MAQTTPTFIPEDIPPGTATTQSGASLRSSYVIRKQSEYITNYLILKASSPPILPPPPTEEELVKLRVVWQQEANIKYPDQGDYAVQRADPETYEPIPLGEEVVSIGGDIREVVGGQPCIVYNWDLSGINVDNPSTDVMTIIYTDCFNNIQRITKTVDDWGANYEVCAGNPDITISGGVITYISNCDLTFKQCTEYFWNLEAYPPLDPVTIDYIDCEGVPVSISTTAGSALSNYCGQKDSFVVSVPPLILLQTCSGGIPETYL